MVCVQTETAVGKGEKHGGLETYFAHIIDRMKSKVLNMLWKFLHD